MSGSGLPARLTAVGEGASSGDERISAGEVIAALSLAIDLSIGFDLEHGLRRTLVAARALPSA